MWPVVLPNSSLAVDSSFPSPSPSLDQDNPRDSPDFFLKDGRKIHVGDTALFEPPQVSPPFIGIIKKLTVDKEKSWTLGVNWLYRPSDVKLGKGILLEAAPNEVFYSFHQDEIPAGSLLHPCKVAFLRKGAELPSGISSFVCRRVYDTESKCLWWLTDKDYVNLSVERQEEVDKLLNKTRLEMHGVVQSGGRSPKPLNGPTSTTQIKPSSDSLQNSASVSSQVKGKKQERCDQVSDPSKRERLHKADDGDFGQSRTDHMIKSEITKITENGGLVDFEGVEKLVQLMQPDSAEKRLDLASRIMIVDVVSMTDRSECLGWFIQLKGLSVLDEWLQEVHKGKIGDGSNPKESEKAIEEFLLASLRALDKLPVYLHALQTCHVGKSVNHLRTHRNAEIQKKARGLVDTWKKRVEAEMNMDDMKSGSTRGVSWPTKAVPSEGSQVGNRKSGASVDPGTRGSIIQSTASKGSQLKVGGGEGIGKLSSSSVSVKVVATSVVGNSKDSNMRTLAGAGAQDLPLTPIKEERSSSSSQSQNNSQSCSGDPAKTVGSSYKEDARSSTTGSVSKSSNSVSRHRKSSNGVHAAAVQKEIGSPKIISSNRNLSEKSSPTGVTQERLTEVPVIDHGNNQRLIVRLPNTVRSPSRGAVGSSYEDSAVMSCKASTAIKHENNDRRMRARNETLLHSDVISGTNSHACQGKDGLGSDEGNLLTTCDEQHKASEDIEKPMEASKTAGSLLAAISRSGKSYDASLSSMDALVESCVKFSEASASVSPDDDVGMNLLASVAAGEIVKSGNVSTSASPQRNSPLPEESCSVNDGKLGHQGVEVGQIKCESNDGAGTGTNENKISAVGCEETKEECAPAVNSSSVNMQQAAEAVIPCVKPDVTPGEVTCDSSVAASPLKNEGHMEIEGANYAHEHIQAGSGWAESNSVLDSKLHVRSPMPKDDKKLDYVDERIVESSTVVSSEAPTSSAKVDKDATYSLLDMDVLEQYNVDKELGGCYHDTDKKPSPSALIQLDSSDRKSENGSQPTASGSKLLMETKAEAVDDIVEGHIGNDEAKVGVGSFVSDHNAACAEVKLAKDEVRCASSHLQSSTVPVQENEASASSSRSKLEKDDSDGVDEPCVSDAQPLGSVAGSSTNVKLDFDLNEGFPVDDGNQGELPKSATFGISSAVHLPCLLPVPISSMSGSFSTSITVAAAAKGAFVPPENPMRGKGELGWKGSAATSAFRPAEPRRSLEMPVNTVEIPAVESSRPSRRPLDFDLNVADEQVLEDVTSQSSTRASCSESSPRDRGSGGLDLDLNRVEENPDAGPFSVSNSSRFELPSLPSRLSMPGGPSNGASNSSRDFDLNNGPGLDEVGEEIASRREPTKSSLPFPSSATAVRINGAEFGNFSSWFAPTNSYSAITVPPSVLPGRGEQSYIAAAGSQRILAPPSASTSFGLEIFRAPVLSSSPAVPFPSATPFPYSTCHFETSFPPSASSFSAASTVYGDSSAGGAICFPAIQSQLVGPSGVVASPYPGPFVMSLPGVAGSVGSDNKKWGGGPIDLNSGPGGSDAERRDERLPSSVRQHSASASQGSKEEQLKAYQLAGGMTAIGVFKRKEPDGGWDPTDRFSCKQASWQ